MCDSVKEVWLLYYSFTGKLSILQTIPLKPDEFEKFSAFNTNFYFLGSTNASLISNSLNRKKSYFIVTII